MYVCVYCIITLRLRSSALYLSTFKAFNVSCKREKSSIVAISVISEFLREKFRKVGHILTSGIFLGNSEFPRIFLLLFLSDTWIIPVCPSGIRNNSLHSVLYLLCLLLAERELFPILTLCFFKKIWRLWSI